MSDPSQLDLSALDRIDRYGGADLLDELLTLFAAETPRRLQAAREALEQGALTVVADTVHPLHSSAGNLGALHLQALVRQAERLARQGDGAALPSLLAEIEGAYTDALAAIEQTRRSRA